MSSLSLNTPDHLAINTASVSSDLQVQQPTNAWADVATDDWDSGKVDEMAVPTSPTTDPPDTVEETDNEFSWTHGRVILKNKNKLLFKEHATGAIVHAWPKNFSYEGENGKPVFINLDKLPISKGDYVRFCKTEVAPHGWDPSKGKNVTGWVQECELHHDQITHNGKPLDNEVATDINYAHCPFKGIVSSSGDKFSIFDVNATQCHTNEDGVKSSSINIGTAFCDASVDRKGIVPDALVEGICIPFESTSKGGEQTDFVVLSIDKITPPSVSKSSLSKSSLSKPSANMSARRKNMNKTRSIDYKSSQGNPLDL